MSRDDRVHGTQE